MTGNPDPSSSSPAAAPTGVLNALQAGRAIASLAVVVHHANLSAVTLNAATMPGVPALSHGALGVDFFFVLSGFIIYYSNLDRRPDSRWAGYFLARRVIRIFLPYWPVGIGVALLYTLQPGMGAGEHRFDWWATVLLVPAHELPALIPAWTLQHEVFFYLVFAVLTLLGGLWLGMAVWTGVLIVLWLPNGPEGSVVLAAMNIEFVAGMLGAWLVVHGRVPTAALLIAGTALAVGHFVVGVLDNSVFFGLGMAGLTTALVDLERRGRLVVPHTLVVLGNASYAIYLVHSPLLSVTTRLATRLLDAWWFVMAVGIAASTAGGLAYYFVYERPIVTGAQRRLRRRLRPRPLADDPCAGT